MVPLPSSSPPSSGEEGGASTPEGLSMADRGLLGAVWAVSALYGVLSDQMLSRQADVPCSVRVDPARGLGLASVVLAILVPAVVGSAAGLDVSTLGGAAKLAGAAAWAAA